MRASPSTEGLHCGRWIATAHPGIPISRVTVVDGVQTIHIARADKKNALTTAMYAAMVDALSEGAARDDVRVHLFRGEPGAFSAGNDIVDFLAMAEGSALGKDVVAFLKALATADKPLVAAVDGLAIGIGTTMLLHLRSRLCLAKIGIPNAISRSRAGA